MGAVRKNDSAIVERLMAEAKDLGIPLSKKNLKVVRTDRRLRIMVSYETTIDLKLTEYVYRFRAEEEAPLF